MMTESVARKSNVDVGEKICRRAYSVDSNKDDFVQIRISTDEKRKLQEVSKNKGVTMSRLIMDLLTVAYF